jgi:aerobic-type carbon monoxide dehydrogenase small subunit (CoxS/CutS family)
VTTSLSVNDRPVTVTHDASTNLLELLRDELRLTGAKKGGDHGQRGDAQGAFLRDRRDRVVTSTRTPLPIWNHPPS